MNIGTLTATLGVNTAGLANAQAAMTQFQNSANASLASVSQSLDKTGRNMYYFGTAATRFLTVPFALGGVAIVKTAKDFEYSMQKIVGLVGVSQTQVDSWSKQLLAMGPALGRGPKELADALYFVTSSGIKGAEALDVVEKSAKASASGLGDTKNIADLVTSAMNAYSDSGLSAGKTMDILTAAVREGKGEATAYANSLGDIIPIASQMGVSFDQVAGAVAGVTLTGQSVSKAVTGVRQALFEIQKPAVESVNALAQMGLSFADLRKELRDKGLLPTLSTLNDLTKTYGETVMAKAFPNIRAYNAVLSLLGDRYTANVALQQRVTNSTGDADKAFAAIGNTIEFKYNQAVSLVQASLIQMGLALKDSVIPIMSGFAKAISNIVQWYTGLSTGTQQFILKLAVFLAALGPVTVAVGLLMRALGGMISTTMIAVKAIVSLNAVMIANPFTAFIATLAVVGTVMYTISKNTGEAAKELSKYNDEIERGKQLSTTQQSIADQMAVISNLNKTQVAALKERITEELKLEDQRGADILAKQNKANDAYVKALMDTTIREKTELGTAMKDRALLMDQGQAYEKNVKQLDSYLKIVDDKLKKFPTKNLGGDSTVDLKQFESIGKVMQDVADQEMYILLATETLGNSFNTNAERTNNYKGALEKLLKIPGVSSTNVEVQTLITLLGSVEQKASFSQKAMDELNAQLEVNKDLNKVMGNEYSLASANLKDYTNTLEKFGRAGITTGDAVDQLKSGISKYRQESVLANKELQENLANIAFQNSILSQGWDMSKNEKQIQDVQKYLQAYTTELERLQKFKLENPQDPSMDAAFQKSIDYVKMYSNELDILNAKQYAIANVGNAFSNLSTVMGTVTAAGELMGDTVGSGIATFLTWMSTIVNTIQAITSLVTFIKALTTAGWLSAASTAGQTAAAATHTATVTAGGVAAVGAAVATAPLIAAQIALAAAYNTAAVTGALAASAWVPFPGNIAAMATSISTMEGLLAGGLAATKATMAGAAAMAEGGIVPEGFPNDRYPAMLTSGEMVVPPGKLPDLQGSGNSEIVVKIDSVIKGTDIHYVVKEVERKYKNSMV